MPPFQPKPCNFEVAATDPAFKAHSPGFLPVPPELLSTLRNAKSVLIVAHTSPDIDCVGSALSLAATCKVAGKQVDVCIDDHLGASGTKLDKFQWVKRATELQGKEWDVAIVVDTSSEGRIGGAKYLLRKAGEVVVVDHHEPDAVASRDLVNIYPSKAHWVNSNLDASALQVTAIAERYFAGATLNSNQLKAIHGPALAGMTTDTKWGSLPGMSPMTPHAFKYGLAMSGLSTDDVKNSYDVQIPQSVRDLAQDPRLIKQAGNDDIRVLKVTALAYEEISARVRRAVPGASDREVTGVLRENADRWVKRGGAKAAAVAIQLDDSVLVTLRSSNGSAHMIATKLGGGGHMDAASCRVRNQTLDQVVQNVIRLA